MTTEKQAPELLRINGLHKQYKRHTALHPLGLTARGGGVLGLLGPNGAGKTTLMRMLSTLLRPSGGEAFVNGHSILSEAETVRGLVGIVNGGMALPSRLTGREILSSVGALHGLSASETKSRIAELDEGLDLAGPLKTRFGECSTGMQQKLVIARAMLHRPALLILDEATNGLDLLARRALLDWVRQNRRPEMLTLYSTHVIAEAEDICDDIVILHKGEMLARGCREQLQRQTNTTRLEDAFFALLPQTERVAL